MKSPSFMSMPVDSDAAALLLAVGRERQRLDVAGLGDGDDHLLVGDQVLDVDLILGVADLGAALVAEALAISASSSLMTARTRVSSPRISRSSSIARSGRRAPV